MISREVARIVRFLPIVSAIFPAKSDPARPPKRMMLTTIPWADALSWKAGVRNTSAPAITPVCNPYKNPLKAAPRTASSVRGVNRPGTRFSGGMRGYPFNLVEDLLHLALLKAHLFDLFLDGSITHQGIKRFRLLACKNVDIVDSPI